MTVAVIVGVTVLVTVGLTVGVIVGVTVWLTVGVTVGGKEGRTWKCLRVRPRTPRKRCTPPDEAERAEPPPDCALP